MRISKQEFSHTLIKRIQKTLAEDPGISRRKLSQQVCVWMNWRAPNGSLQEMSCRKALNRLAEKGQITLPEITREYAFSRERDREKQLDCTLQHVEGTLDDIGDIEVILIKNRRGKSSAHWHTFMKTYHPLGDGPLCGRQLRYLVSSSKHGWLGALSFSGAAWHLKDRDNWIGWNDEAREMNLQYVVCNSRFLILPTVRVANLASCILSKSLKRLGKDWKERYGYEPALVESYVDPAHQHTGTSYKASNWIPVGYTAGRKTPYPNGKVSTGKKSIYVYRLISNWQQVLCRELEQPLGSLQKPSQSSTWVEAEFGGVAISDDRLKQRLYSIVEDIYEHPGALVPQASGGDSARAKGMYRFLSNPKIDMQKLLRPHYESTVIRMGDHPVVLAVQDTTSFNYSSHPHTRGIGPIMDNSKTTLGMFMHDTLAFSEAGVPLGLLHVQCWARDPKDEGKGKKRHSLPIEAKESYKWIISYRIACEAQAACPNTRVVSVGDREADIYELFVESAQSDNGADLLIRSIRSRNRKTASGYIWDTMAKHPITGYREIVIPKKGTRVERVAQLSIRFSRVELQPPESKHDLPSVCVWAVYAREEDTGGEDPVEWMLLTTVGTDTFEEACTRVEWYVKRWGIEVFHRTLKSGCKVEKRQLQDITRLKNSLAIDLVVAWRIFYLTINGRKTPDVSCEAFLSEQEWKVLSIFKKKSVNKPPTLHEAILMIAGMGGFLNRTSDGYPGCTVMWRGLKRLSDILIGYHLGQAAMSTRAPPDWRC